MNSEQAIKSNSSFSDVPEDFAPYKAVSKAAVISLLLAGVGILSLMFPTLMIIPILGVLFAVQAWFSLNKYPDELTGRGMAITGGMLSLLLTVGGTGYHTYVYLTEVPEGYERISFTQLQPENAGQVLPDNIDELNRAKVFLKGYMHPSGTQGMGEVTQFILVPDMGTCCFGGQPELTDMVQVTLESGLTTHYNRSKKKLAGIFKVDSKLKPVSGLNGVYYSMDADYVKN